MRIVGIETEYGVSAPGSELGPEVLSELVIRALAPVVPDRVTVAAAKLGPEDLAANRVLWNGARAYVDHAHPEYSSPETASPSQLVAYDLAGDRLFADAAKAVTDATGVEVRVYRNTTDGKGSSYGRHENHLVSRDTGWQKIVDVMTGFLVARVPLVGAGRVGIGQRGERPGYQISQRADFLVTPIGLQTTHDRPILNTRDEPHADPRRWRRLHVITGDPAFNEVQTWLTVGSASLVLAATEAGAVVPVRWANPVLALQSFSHDTTMATTAETVDGRRLTCLDGMELYLEAVEAFVANAGEAWGDGTGQLLAAWRQLLDDLRSEPSATADRLDWVAKLRLLDGLRSRAACGWDDHRLAALDLLWADLERSPAHGLAARGASRRVVTDDQIDSATTEPPPDTRAWLRGTLVRRFPDDVASASWDDLLIRRRGGRLQHLPMPDPLGYSRASVPAAASCPDLDALISSLGR